MNFSLVNFLLGVTYGLTAIGILRLINLFLKATKEEYFVMLSKKSYFLGLWYAIAATCITVSYQNFFGDFSDYLLWWRYCLITSICAISWKWAEFCKKIREVAQDGLV